MAAVSGKHVTGASGVGTSSRGVGEEFWSYAVPADNDTQYATEERRNPSREAPTQRAQRQPLNTQVNGSSRPKPKRVNSPGVDSQPPRSYTETLNAPFQDSYNTTDETGSNTHDMYPSHYENTTRAAARDRPEDVGKSGVKRQGSLSALSVLEDAPADEDQSKWIHRDKLAKIESREMMEMGMRLAGRSSRTGTRTAGKKSVKSMPNLDPEEEQQLDLQPEEYTSRDGKSAWAMSQPPAVDEAMEEQGDSNSPTKDSEQSRAHLRRPSTSRIPVMTSSPSSPTSDEQSQRIRSDSFGQNSAKASRAHSGSTGSQNVLNSATTDHPAFRKNPPNGIRTPDQASPPMQSSPQASPQHVKQTSRLPTGTNARKPARGGRAVSGPQRSGTDSGSDSPRRPNTSGGSRPTTARPEGEAPWIATMYKPDPRLPPDQQMLPTHAKRIAMEEAEKEAKERRLQNPPQEEFTFLEDDDTAVQDDEDDQAARHDDQDGQHQEERNPDDQGTYLNYTESGQEPEIVQAQESDVTAEKSGPYRTPENRNSAPWPLKTPTPSATPVQSPKDANGEWQNGRSGTPVTGGYNLMPAVQGSKEVERLSQRSGVSNQNATSPQPPPTRLPEEPDEKEEGKKKKSCACCIVM